MTGSGAVVLLSLAKSWSLGEVGKLLGFKSDVDCFTLAPLTERWKSLGSDLTSDSVTHLLSEKESRTVKEWTA